MSKNETVMTVEEIRAELAEKSAAIDANITAWNEASLNVNFTEMVRLDNALKDLEKDYAEIAQKLLFTELKAMPNPMLEAIKAHSFTVVRHKDSAEAGTTMKTRERINQERQFDLYDFDLFCASKASKDAKWVRLAENVNMLICMRVASDLHIEDLESVGKSYFISKTAQQIKLSEEGVDVANPLSNTQLLAILQRVIDNVIYEDKLNDAGESIGNKYKAMSHDVNWLLYTYGRKDSKGKLTIKVADHKAFRKIVADILHRIVTGTSYKVAYKQMIKK